jgi:hypothetical protein
MIQHQSTERLESKVFPGVSFLIRKMSFAGRLELLKRARELHKRIDYCASGSEAEQLEAAELEAEMDRLFLDWGLVALEGLAIDGEPATPLALIERGPQELAQEIVAAVKRQLGLSAEERKN